MEWLRRRRAWRDYERGAIMHAELRTALGLPPEEEVGSVEQRDDRPTVYYTTTSPDWPQANVGDLWVDPTRGTLQRYRGPGLGWGAASVGAMVSDAGFGGDTAADAMAAPSVRPVTWADSPSTDGQSGDLGLAMLLFGYNCVRLRSARHAADAVREAGWRHDSLGDVVLARLLHNHDLREWRNAEDAATLIESVGYRRVVPEVGGGWMGVGSAPITDDEWAAIDWRLRRGGDARSLVDEVLAARPVDDGPVDGGPEPSDVAQDCDDKPEDPRQPWAVYADLYDKIARLIVDPRETSAPHCAFEYNGGLANALDIVEALVHEAGGSVTRPTFPPEGDGRGDGYAFEQEVRSLDDVSSLLAALTKAIRGFMSEPANSKDADKN